MGERKLVDKVFSVAKKAKDAMAELGEEKVVNATIGSLYDETGKLAVLDTAIIFLPPYQSIILLESNFFNTLSNSSFPNESTFSFSSSLLITGFSNSLTGNLNGLPYAKGCNG